MSIQKLPYNHTLLVAEIGTSHGGSIEKAKKLIDVAATAGADCIKFQWVYANEILHPNTGTVKLPGGNIRLYDRFKELEVEPSFFSKMKEYVHLKGKLFSCSPFGLKSLRELFSLKPDYIKIASPELNHYPLLKELVHLELTLPPSERIPVIISTGVSELADIKNAVKILSPIIQPNTDSLILLHCITSYPAPESEYNLATLQTLTDIFSLPVGVSDHSLNPTLIPVLSIACGSCTIEKHITLNNDDSGLDDPVALNPKDFTKMVKAVRRASNLDMEGLYSDCFYEFGEETVEKIIGDGIKHLAISEKSNYGRTNRSIHVMHDMKAGDIIKENDIAVLRTEKKLMPGMSPIYYEQLFGKKLLHSVASGQGLLEKDVIF
ncbi:MAG: spore coat protein [Treponema sp. CETP13]|nr:MAG: spore coat protein [Treponema sp. CETP13]